MSTAESNRDEIGYRPPPKDVLFTYPEGGELRGRIPEDGEIYRDLQYGEWTYRKCIQLIMVDDGEQMIRFTYYRKRKGGSWVFAGQTSLLVEIEGLQEMIKEAIEKKWMRL